MLKILFCKMGKYTQPANAAIKKKTRKNSRVKMNEANGMDTNGGSEGEIKKETKQL